mmetsp:Transcript_101344/g.312572  ORF Transcript_101344/g.312572 Transcript_101344/m.312572 type:complete len:243 (+) Transcript_101344:2-730(+)
MHACSRLRSRAPGCMADAEGLCLTAPPTTSHSWRDCGSTTCRNSGREPVAKGQGAPVDAPPWMANPRWSPASPGCSNTTRRSQRRIWPPRARGRRRAGPAPAPRPGRRGAGPRRSGPRPGPAGRPRPPPPLSGWPAGRPPGPSWPQPPATELEWTACHLQTQRQQSRGLGCAFCGHSAAKGAASASLPLTARPASEDPPQMDLAHQTPSQAPPGPPAPSCASPPAPPPSCALPSRPGPAASA